MSLGAQVLPPGPPLARGQRVGARPGRMLISSTAHSPRLGGLWQEAVSR